MTVEPITFSLGLDDIDDGAVEPRRLLQLPCKSLLAYGGDDGIISCLVDKENKFQALKRYEDAVRAVAFSDDGKRVVVGFETGEVEVYKFDDYEGGTIHPFARVTAKDDVDENDLLSQDLSNSHKDSFPGPQFDLPIRDLQFLPQTFWLVVATESGMCIIDVTSSESLDKRLLEREVQEHHNEGGIRGVAINRPATLMASLGMDGRLCVWDVKEDDSNTPKVTLLQREKTVCITKKDYGEVHGADAFDRSCRPLFGKNSLVTPGQLLPLIRRIKGEKQLETMEATNVEEDGHIESIVTIAFFNESYLVTSGRDCRVILWKCDYETGVLTPVKSVKLESAATDICLRDGKTAYVACANGTCGVLNFEADFQASMEKENQDPIQDGVTKKVTLRIDDDDDDDDDVDFNTNESSSNSTKKSRFVDDEAEDDDEDNEQGTNDDSNLIGGEDKEQENEDIQFDNSLPAEDDDDNYGDLSKAPFRASAAIVPTTPPQPAFSVSSTPLDLARRFLCWNHVGSITILHGDDEFNNRNTIDINFTDSAYKRPISFTDNMNFIIGAMGEDGAIFASDLQEEDDDNDSIEENLDDLQMSERTKQAVKRSHKKRNNKSGKPMGSSIFFYRFETFGSLRDKDWYLKLPDGERVLGSACGQGWAAVMTSRRFLRIFSSGGNQNQVVWLNGDPVTMAGHSRFLAVFYHKASPLPDKTQQLGYSLWDTTSFNLVSEGSVSCISKGSSLTWVGFSNDCSLMAMDSDGMLSMLVPCGGDDLSSASWAWAPVLDTVGLRKSADDRFWPVSVYDGKLICVPLKGGNLYPDAARRPVTTTLGLRMPLAKSAIVKNTILEEVSVRSNLALAQKQICNDTEDANFEQEYTTMCAQVDKVTLKLFASTLDAGKVERALDLVDRLHLEKSYDLAIRLADHNRKLVDFIYDAKERKFMVEAEMDETEEYSEDDSPGTDFMDRLAPSRQISPDASHNVKRTLGHQANETTKRTRVS